MVSDVRVGNRPAKSSQMAQQMGHLEPAPAGGEPPVLASPSISATFDPQMIIGQLAAAPTTQPEVQVLRGNECAPQKLVRLIGYRDPCAMHRLSAPRRPRNAL